MQMATQEIRAQEALDLLKGWFNNKMTVVMFRIQYAHVHARKAEPIDVREQLIFLNDVQHHYLREGHDKRAYHNAAKWLKAFFKIYPKRITPDRTGKAWKMVREIYEGLGIRYPFGDDENRSVQ